MVMSRDALIEELNDRVAVFEDDKMVLKAALRQLQKEMKEEAPKTKKLMDDLQASRDGTCIPFVAYMCCLFVCHCVVYVCMIRFVGVRRFHPGCIHVRLSYS